MDEESNKDWMKRTGIGSWIRDKDELQAYKDFAESIKIAMSTANLGGDIDYSLLDDALEALKIKLEILGK